MIGASSDSRQRMSHRISRYPLREPSPHRLLDRLVYLPGALVLIYGLWLTLTA